MEKEGSSSNAAEWATEGNTDTIPDSKIPDSVARDSEIPDTSNLLNQSQVDARIQANVADWAETGNTATIPASKVPDDSVGLVQLAHGTANKFLGFDNEGNPAELNAPNYAAGGMVVCFDRASDFQRTDSVGCALAIRDIPLSGSEVGTRFTITENSVAYTTRQTVRRGDIFVQATDDSGVRTPTSWVFVGNISGAVGGAITKIGEFRQSAVLDPRTSSVNTGIEIPVDGWLILDMGSVWDEGKIESDQWISVAKLRALPATTAGANFDSAAQLTMSLTNSAGGEIPVAIGRTTNYTLLAYWPQSSGGVDHNKIWLDVYHLNTNMTMRDVASVTSENIANGTITTDKIADGAVTVEKIGDISSIRGAQGPYRVYIFQSVEEGPGESNAPFLPTEAIVYDHSTKMITSSLGDWSQTEPTGINFATHTVYQAWFTHDPHDNSNSGWSQAYPV